jgi:lipid-binding SYLF domain-containing protein
MRRSCSLISALASIGLLAPIVAQAQSSPAAKLADAGQVMRGLSAEASASIPADLLRQARAVAVLPGVIRGGLLIGGRRGKGVLVSRSATGAWDPPVFVTVTGGSIGWQVGAESVDIVLLFVGERAWAEVARGRFTLGGELAATAGPIGRSTTATAAFKENVYAYVQSRGLFAGAALEGAKIGIDEAANEAFYGQPAGSPTSGYPAEAADFLAALAAAEGLTAPPANGAEPTEATLYPLGGP